MALEPWIETHSGKKMYFLDPQPDMIDINDIAHSLSLQCRFSGHTSKFYSVAEHSIRVAGHLFATLNPEIALEGLLHDATEAYLLDVPSPVKQYLGGYYAMEDRLARVIFNKYKLTYPMHSAVKFADTIMLKNEAEYLLPSKGESWIHLYPTDTHTTDTKPACLSSEVAEEAFLYWFNFLYNEVLNAVHTNTVIA